MSMVAAAHDVGLLLQSETSLAVSGGVRRMLFLVAGLAGTIVWFLAIYAGLRFAQRILPRSRDKKAFPDSVPAVGLIAGLFLATLVYATTSRHGAPWPADTWLHQWSLSHRPDVAADAAIVVTTTATGFVAYPLAGLAGWFGVTNRRPWVGPLAVISALALVQLIRFALAVAIGRVRPPVADWAWHASGPAMPSGHTTTSAFVAVLVAYGCGRRWPQHRGAIGAACAVWAVAVGVSRVYLGVHWPTDVVAGWLLVVVLAAATSVALKTAVRRSASTKVDGTRTDVR